jgi:formiminotetrahydrofolate cyclodeaminase
MASSEDDVAAFGAVTEAYRLPKDDGEAATRDALAVLAALEDRREEST